MDKTKELGEKPIGSLLIKYSIPAVIAMVVNAIYNIVDRIFIGNYVGEEALGALVIAFPLMMIIFAFASLVGAGAGALMSIKLGEKNRREASHVFGNSISVGFIITAVTLIVIYINLDSLLVLLGASVEILPDAKSYMNIILVGFVFQILSFILNNTVRVEAQPLLPMVAMLSSAIINIILDFVFIAVFDWGVQGAAIATITGQFVGFVILMSFYLRRKSSLHIMKKDLVPNFKIIGEIFTIGFSSFIGTVGVSVAMTILNRSLGEYGGNAAITSMGAINSLYALFIMPIMGLQQGMQPIVGYNYGAKLIKRSYATLKIALVVSTIFATLVFAALQLFPELFIGMFMDSKSETMGIAVDGLRIFMLMLPLLSINILGVAFFQSTGNGRMALILSLLRQFILLIPLVYILPQFFGLAGVWFATPISDGLSIFITFIALIWSYKKTKSLGINKELQKVG